MENDPKFYIHLVQHNVKRLQIISTIFIIIMSILATITIASELKLTNKSPFLGYYITLYGLIILINLYMFFKLSFKKHDLSNNVFVYYKKFGKMIHAYVSLIILLSMTISILDQIQYTHTIVYAFTMVIFSSLLLLNSWAILIPIISSLAIIAITLNVFYTNWSGSFYHLQFLLLTIPVMLVVSRLSYIHFVQQYKTLKDLQDAHLKINELVKELTSKNQELELVALKDELTQIANRHGYHQYLSTLCLQQTPIPITAMLIDIDYFKKYNDYFGHTLGDEALKKVAHILQQVCTQENAFVARWGGEEFLLLAKNKKPDEIIKLYNLIIDRINACQIEHPQSEISNYLTLCVGAYQENLYTIDQLHHFIVKADSILYEVKEAGRNGFKFMKEGQLLYNKTRQHA